MAEIDIHELINKMKREIVEEVRACLDLPQFLNRATIAKLWGLSCQSNLKKWQLPNFGVPEYFNGRSPMYRRSDVLEIIDNPQPFKEKWASLTIKEKQLLIIKTQKIKEQEEMLCK